MNNIDIVKCKNKNESAHESTSWVIEEIKEVLSQKELCRIVVPTGGSPKRFFEVLTEKYVNAVDWSRVVWVTLDELYRIPVDHPESFYTYLRINLLEPLGRSYDDIHTIDSEAFDVDVEMSIFKQLCQKADLTILGVGADGHIGMNFPPAKRESSVHLLDLPESALPPQELFQNKWDKRPTQGITMGIADILSSKKIVLLVDGKAKADAVAHLLQGNIDPVWPVTFLNEHDSVHLFVTEDVFGVIQ